MKVQIELLNKLSFAKVRKDFEQTIKCQIKSSLISCLDKRVDRLVQMSFKITLSSAVGPEVDVIKLFLEEI